METGLTLSNTEALDINASIFQTGIRDLKYHNPFCRYNCVLGPVAAAMYNSLTKDTESYWHLIWYEEYISLEQAY